MSLDMLRLIEDYMDSRKREDDMLLHPSSDLADHLRHTQLRMLQRRQYKGIPSMAKRDVASSIRLMTGTIWHELFEKAIDYSSIPAITEVDLTPGLPTGWAGTADLLVWDSLVEGFRLWDFKTTKAEAIQYIIRDGAKQDHKWQGSAYWEAAHAMSLPMVDEISILYWPLNELSSKPAPKVTTNPEVVNFSPIRSVNARMIQINYDVMEYIDETYSTGNVLNDKLADPPPRVQHVKKKGDKWDVLLGPDWRAPYCPAAGNYNYCPCGDYKFTKIGEYSDGKYTPRKGYEKVNLDPPIVERLESFR